MVGTRNDTNTERNDNIPEGMYFFEKKTFLLDA